MNRKLLKRKLLQFSIFSEKSLILLVSVVTFLLQLISFVTTWHGSKVYLEGIFPYASLLFAVAVQATAYFFSNSLRNNARPLKLLALGIALCCSTYYSYIGIYNFVNSPVTYLQERYATISSEMTQLYEETLETSLDSAQEIINDASSAILTEYTELMSVQQNITDCQNALSELQVSYADNMRAPSRYSYENYEDYAAAYQAYINAISQSNTTENEALRNQTLAAYGYASMDALNQANQQNLADSNTLQTILSITKESDITVVISEITTDLSTAIANAKQGVSLQAATIANLNKLLQAAKLCGLTNIQSSQITNIVNSCAQASSAPLLKTYEQLIASLPEGVVTDANTMTLKSMMDSEILSATLKLNMLLSSNMQIASDDPAYEIIDLYLLPIYALQSTTTRMVALFCLLMAALTDALSVLFALSLKPRRELWKRHSLALCRMEDYETMIYAALPEFNRPALALEKFLSGFSPSPQTESEGYMLQASLGSLQNYQALVACLCQVNLAKIIASGDAEHPTDLLLLKARFVFWSNSMIYKEKEAALYE